MILSEETITNILDMVEDYLNKLNFLIEDGIRETRRFSITIDITPRKREYQTLEIKKTETNNKKIKSFNC